MSERKKTLEDKIDAAIQWQLLFLGVALIAALVILPVLMLLGIV